MSGGQPIRFPGQGGEEIPGWLHVPDTRNGAGVVVIHEVFGLDDFTRGVCERLVGEGYTALAPDLYAREGLPGPPSDASDPAPAWTMDQIRGAVSGLPDRRALADIEGALERLAAEPGVEADRLAVLGFCMGGNLAFLAGCTSRRVSAVVDFYGRIVYAELSARKPTQPLEMALNLQAPLLGLFGSDDASIPPGHVQLMRERLSQFAKTFEIVTYDGAGHGFANPLRAHHPEAAADAWRRVFAFLGETVLA